MLTFSNLWMLLLMSPASQVTVDHLEVIMDSGPNRSQMEIMVENPFDEPLVLDELLLEFPRSAEEDTLNGSFFVDLRQFLQIESESYDDMDVFWLKFRNGAQTIAPQEKLTLKIGFFMGEAATTREDILGRLNLKASSGDWQPVTFRLTYTEPEVQRDGKTVVTIAQTRFKGGLAIEPVGPCKRASFTFSAAVTSVTCSTPAVCLYPFSCQRDNSVTDPINVSTTLNVPRCNCL